MPVPAPVEKFIADLDKVLHQQNKATEVLATLEEKSGVKRLHIVGGTFFLKPKKYIYSFNFRNCWFARFVLVVWPFCCIALQFHRLLVPCLCLNYRH